MLDGTSAIVTPCTGSGRCTVENLGHVGSDLSADILCFDFEGQPRDMTYSIALVGDPFQNLVQNGSFESPSIGHGINGFVSTVPGWTSDIFDIWSGLNGMPAYDGEQNLELDTNDSRIGQGITVGICLNRSYNCRPDLLTEFCGGEPSPIQREPSRGEMERDSSPDCPASCDDLVDLRGAGACRRLHVEARVPVKRAC